MENQIFWALGYHRIVPVIPPDAWRVCFVG